LIRGTPQLPSASIINLHCDGSGRLWVSTSRGLALREAGKWRALVANDGWPSDYVRTFSERGNGDLLITTFYGQVFEVVGGRLTELPAPPGAPRAGYLGCVDEAGHWWVAQHQFIGLWDGQRWKPTVASTTTNSDRVGCGAARDGGVWLLMEKELRKYRQGIEVSRVQLPEVPGSLWSISEDSRGNVWISTAFQGLCRISPDGRMRRWTRANGLAALGTSFVFEDRESNLWVGTSGGLTRFRPRRFQSFGVESGLAELVVDSLWPSRDGGLWIATGGKGLFRLHDGVVTNVPLSDPNKVILAQSVLTDRKGLVWLGTSVDLWVSDKENFRRVHSDKLSRADIRALFEDSRGRIWIGGAKSASVLDGENLRVFTDADGLPADGAYCFAEDSHGVIWLSTRNGVFRLENDRFIELLDNGRPLRNVTSFKTDADGILWMGSLDHTLLCLRNGRVTRIAGLPIRAVLGILEDGAGFFWLTSNRGVVRVPAKDLRSAAEGNVSRLDCQLFDLSDGLPSVECAGGQQPTCAMDATGRLWFATLKGVATIDPAAFRLNTNPPPVTVEQVVYHTQGRDAVTGGEGQVGSSGDPSLAVHSPPATGYSPADEVEVRLASPFTEPLRLPAGSRQIEIHYTALSFSAPEKVRFQVKLDSHDADWRDAGSLRVASFYDLPPGDYLFRVRAANDDGVWNEAGVSLHFKVLPFFWETWWFRIVVGLALLSSGAAVAWLAARARLRRAAERERAVKTRNILAAIVDSSDDAILSKTLEGTITSWNAGAEKMYGYSASEMVGQHLSILAPADLKEEVPGILELIKRGESVDHLETARVTKDGRRIDVSLTISPIKDDHGMIIGASSIARDTTERRRDERALQHLTGRLLTLQDEERQRVAAELHDGLGQSLAIIKNRALIGLGDQTNPDRARDQLEEICATATSAILEVREIAHNLRPYELDRLGLVAAIDSMMGRVSDATHINLSADLERIEGLLSPAAETSVYRIVQEGLNNVVKHSQATAARIEIKKVGKQLVISVKDNGKGMPLPSPIDNGGNGGGFGLAGIAQRVLALSGSFAIESQPGQGTTLIVRLEASNAAAG